MRMPVLSLAKGACLSKTVDVLLLLPTKLRNPGILPKLVGCITFLATAIRLTGATQPSLHYSYV